MLCEWMYKIDRYYIRQCCKKDSTFRISIDSYYYIGCAGRNQQHWR